MNALLRASMLAFTLFAVGSAFAQPKPALVKDIDQPGRTIYQETIVLNCSTSCSGQFSAVPAGKRLVVTWVSAIYTLSTSGLVSYGSLARNDMSGVTVFLPPSPVPWAAPEMIINTPTLMYVDAGSSALLSISGVATVQSATATLVGYYISVP